MFDLKWIRENPEAFDAGLARRGLDPHAETVLSLDTERRELQAELQEIQARRNEASKAIGAAKAKGEDAQALIDEIAGLKTSIKEGEEAERLVVARIGEILAALPNLPAADVPNGDDENANLQIRVVGTRPEIGFAPKEHFDLGEALGQMDFEAAARMSGARFVVLKGALARLDRALGAFMLDLATTEFGYTEVVPPLLVRDEAAFGTGQLPKFADDLFRTGKPDRGEFDKFVDKMPPVEGEIQARVLAEILWKGFERGEFDDHLWLIPTAEVPLTNMVRGQILDDSDLPMRMAALTPCFRSEAGSAGKDTRGMIRQHQFNKVELVSIVHPDKSDDELERLTGCAEEVLNRLGIHYRVVSLCTGDLGFSAHKTYDIEVWLPGQGTFREISSCSTYGDFQARRMDARFRTAGQKGTRFVHTLNGSSLAVGRTLVAILENFQQADGSIAIPDVLVPYMGGVRVITAAGAA